MTSRDQRQAVRELFDSTGEEYDERQYRAGVRTLISDRQRVVAKVLRGMGLPEGTRMLDVACGPGRLLSEGVVLGFRAVGIDGSLDMLGAATARAGAGTCLVQGDASRLPFPDAAFDLVTCTGLIEYFSDPVPLLNEMLRVLRLGGWALVASTNRLSPAHMLEPLANPVRRSPTARRVLRALRLPFDEMSLRERTYRLTFHTPRELSGLLQSAGFDPPSLRSFHVQFIPHPLDRMMPMAATACLAVTDRLLWVPLVRMFSEGVLAVAQRPSPTPPS